MKTEWQQEEKLEIAFYLGAMFGAKKKIQDHCASITEFSRLIDSIHQDFVDSLDDYIATFLDHTISQDYINRKEREIGIPQN